METKVCNRCKEEKPTSEFYKDSTRPGKLLYHCKACHKLYTGSPENLARRREYRNSPRGKMLVQEWQFKTKYGITTAQWEAQLIAQAGRCASCGDPFMGDRAPDIDHCHKSGQFRGLLCSACNTSEGLLQSSSQRVLALLQYVCENNGEDIHEVLAQI